MGGSFDFLYAFDVYVHFDLHSIWQHLREINRLLRTGGRAFLHTTNLRAPDGWTHFAEQDRYSVEGHYPITPDVLKTLLEHTSLAMITESKPDPENLYLNRDYLVVVERRS